MHHVETPDIIDSQNTIQNKTDDLTMRKEKKERKEREKQAMITLQKWQFLIAYVVH